jgi:hypothetical protein
VVVVVTKTGLDKEEEEEDDDDDGDDEDLTGCLFQDCTAPFLLTELSHAI